MHNIPEEVVEQIRILVTPYAPYGKTYKVTLTEVEIDSTAIEVRVGHSQKLLGALDFSWRAQHCFDELGVKTLGELAQRTTEEVWKNHWGRSVFGEIEDKLSAYGLSLKTPRTNIRDRTIRDIGLPIDLRDLLIERFIITVKELCGETEKTLMTIHEIDEARIKQIKKALNKIGLSLNSGKSGGRAARSLRSFAEEFQLSTRTYNCLINTRIETVGELCARTESQMLHRTKNFGIRSLEELKNALSQWKLNFLEG